MAAGKEVAWLKSALALEKSNWESLCLEAILDDAQACVDKAQNCLEEVGDAMEESKKVTEGKELKVLLQPLALLSLAPHPAAVSVLYSSASCVCT